MIRKENKICNNCGKIGHRIYECILPTISIGVILFRIKNNKREYLMIRRNSSFGYIDIIKKKRKYQDKQLQCIVDEMTNDEKNTILERINKNDLNINNDVSLFIKSSTTNWVEPEWGFPKGRRNPGEKDINCGIREFVEETGYSHEDINIIDNVVPYEEIFTGSNNKIYKQKYYLAFNSNNIDILDKYQKSEVSQIGWFTIEECLQKIRPYNIEKKKLIETVHFTLDKYSIIKI
jgi:8-oxo-dGTP pyrophosphatase MutT (NUDIX family)